MSASSTSDTTSSTAESPSPTSELTSHVNRQMLQHRQEQSSDDEVVEEIECPSFVRDRTITRALHEYEVGDENQFEPDFSWDARTISQHLAKYLDDLCGWVPDPKVQYRRMAPQGKGGQKNNGGTSAKIASRTDLEAQVRRLSMTSRVTSRMKVMAMEFEFRHYHNPKKYMEQYRRFHTCGGPLEKLATQDASYGRKRSIYYAGEASAEAGFKPETAPPKQEVRLTASQLQPATPGERNDGSRLSPSRLRNSSESRSEHILNKSDTNSVASASTLPRAASSTQYGSPSESTTLPRYCTLTEAAMRKRQMFAPWSTSAIAKDGRPTTRVGVSTNSKSTRDNDHLKTPNLPTSLSVMEEQSPHPLKPQSRSPPGLRHTNTAPTTNNGFRPTLHNHASVAHATDDAKSAVQQAGPPVGQHPFWKPTHFRSTNDNQALPVAFGLVTRLSKNTLLKAIDEELSDYEDGNIAGNFSTGVTLDDSCYGYQSDSMTSSEGSAFRDFYSHLLQAAHYLRLAGRQKSSVNASKQQLAPRQHFGPALYKSPKTITVTSGPDENFVPGFADPIPANIAVDKGLGIRGQRLSSATGTNPRSSHSAAPALGGSGGGTTRHYVNASAFQSAQARYNSSPVKSSRPAHDSDSHSGSSRKKFISLEPPATAAFREGPTRSGGDGGVAGSGGGKFTAANARGDTGKVYEISIPNKPCAVESAPVNRAAVCQAVCIESASKEAIALGSSPKR